MSPDVLARDLERRRLAYETAKPSLMRRVIAALLEQERRTGHLSRVHTASSPGMREAHEAGYVESVRLKGDVRTCWYVTPAGLAFLNIPAATPEQPLRTAP